MTDQVSQNEIYLMLGRLEGKVDAFLSKATDQDKRMDAQDRRMDIHSERIGNLERHKYWLLGVAAGVGGAASAIVNYFPKLFGHQ